jgi:MFS transporter, ACS family, pantothenate transporter
MWAMIGTSIALVIWTSGLLYMATKTEKKRVAEAQVEFGDEKNFESVPGGNVKV